MGTLSRRTILAAASAMFAAPLAQAKPRIDLTKRALTRLERKSGGRLGVCILDTATGQTNGHRLDERFAMCSTFKLPLAANVLQRTDVGTLALDTILPYTKADIVFNSPVTEANLEKGGMAVRDLAEAAQKRSDNAAANLLLRQLGGPLGFTQFFRDLGDDQTRLDRYEPEMNDVRVGDERDTTTPRAMARLVGTLLGEGGLPADARATLRTWMVETATGAARVRAGLPAEWLSGDKTGTGGGGDRTVMANDVVWIEPPGRAPLVVAAYFDTGVVGDWPTAEQEAVLAEVGRLVAHWAGAGGDRVGATDAAPCGPRPGSRGRSGT